MVVLYDYNEDYLAHHGVKGMHWGVRNAETLRKYAGAGKRKFKTVAEVTKNGAKATGRFIGKGAKKTGSMVLKGAKRAFNTVEANHENQQDVKKLRNDSASSRRGRKEFDKVRNRTLKSHNPEVIALGLHTLTDSELNAKIDRLEREKKVRDMANSQAQSRYDSAKKREEALKAKKERRASGASGKLMDAGLSVIKTNITYAGKNGIDKVFGINAFSQNKGKDKPNNSGDSTKYGETVVGEILNVETVHDEKTKKRQLLP